jgi:acyl-CoA reductase-like NAD-dependent aldehyde dehydrogenase
MRYGGVKKSGIGREGPHFVVEEITEMKLVRRRANSAFDI